MDKSAGCWWHIGLTLIVLAASVGLPGTGPWPPRSVGAEPATATVFSETGVEVAADIMTAWAAGGGLAIFGLPLTPERVEINEEDSQPLTVQWFERARFERQTGPGGTPTALQLTHLGRWRQTHHALTPARGGPVIDARLFPETGQQLAGLFRTFWEANGGVAIFGYPLTGEMRAEGSDGQAPIIQYFERARLEDHGPDATPRLRLGLIGRELLDQPVSLQWEAEDAPAHTFSSAFVYSGKVLSHDQALYVESRELPPGADRYRAQYTLRLTRPATYTLWSHLLDLTEASPLRWRIDDQPWQVVDGSSPPLGLRLLRPPHRYAWYRLGSARLTAGWHQLEIEVVPTARPLAIAGIDTFLLTTAPGPPVDASGQLVSSLTIKPAQVPAAVVNLQSDLAAAGGHWQRLHRGLAQGGEETDPAYLARAAPQLRELGTRYVRLDHIFDYYDVLQRDRRRFAYDFSRLDAALDAVLASGAQPFISLGLSPRLLAERENDPPMNLRAWQGLVTATVRHINVTRGLGVRYWEVWNEPNLGPFWSGTFADYARLYRATAEAVTDADPTALVGGPATAGHEFWLDALIDDVIMSGSRLDFISWHIYHVRPAMLTNQIAHVRRSLARHPRLSGTELIISEWNLHSDFGARTNFVSDGPVVAAYLAAMVQTMADGGLNQALFFEAVDGRPPPGQDAWGRWGVLTYAGQPKPTYHTLAAMQRLHDRRLPGQSDNPQIGLLSTRDGPRLALLIWHLAPSEHRPQTVRLTLRNAPTDMGHLQRALIDTDHSRLGEPLAIIEPLVGQVDDAGVWTATLTLAPNSVTLLTTD